MDKNKKGGAMNDFDFEELDKAVSSLAAKTKTDNNLPLSSAPSPVTVTPAARRTSPTASEAPASISVSTEPPSSHDQSAPDASPQPQPAAHAQPVVQHAKRLATTQPKQRGAFMDIMAPRKAAAHRTGLTLQPMNNPADAKPAPAEDQQTPQPAVTKAPTPLSEPEQTPNKAPIEAKNLEDHAPEIMTDTLQAPEPEPKAEPQHSPAKPDEPAWPDPLDFDGGFHGDEPQPKDSHADEAPHEEEKPAPTSPFLPEAKVEKRPLGAFSGFRAKPADAQDATAMPANAPELKAEDELTPEADGTFKQPETPKAPTMHDAPKEKDQKTAKPDLHGAAMMSIPKQYHTKEKPADTATRPIFDTKEYHPPLLEAAVHEHRGGSSMWSKLFIALATLVLLGVAGYFAYLYFVQQ